MKHNILISFIILLAACNSLAENKWNKAMDMLENNKLKDSITIFNEIINNHPQSEYAIKSQFQIAEIYLNDKKNYDIAIEEFEKVIRLSPSSTEAKNALFMISYIHNNYLNAYSNAIINYNIFLNKYPDDDLIPSVKYELKGLEEYQLQIDSLNNQKNK